jgi:hypothetical protein
MTRSLIAQPARSPRPSARPKLVLAGALALAFLTSGCDKCGDWAWNTPAKTCHDESQLK